MKEAGRWTLDSALTFFCFSPKHVFDFEASAELLFLFLFSCPAHFRLFPHLPARSLSGVNSEGFEGTR